MDIKQALEALHFQSKTSKISRPWQSNTIQIPKLTPHSHKILLRANSSDTLCLYDMLGCSVSAYPMRRFLS